MVLVCVGAIARGNKARGMCGDIWEINACGAPSSNLVMVMERFEHQTSISSTVSRLPIGKAMQHAWTKHKVYGSSLHLPRYGSNEFGTFDNNHLGDHLSFPMIRLDYFSFLKNLSKL